MPLEVLDVAFVLLGGLAGVEDAEVAPPAGLRIDLARIKPVLAALEFSDHGSLLAAPIRREAKRSFTNRTGRSRRNSGAPGSSRGTSWRLIIMRGAAVPWRVSVGRVLCHHRADRNVVRDLADPLMPCYFTDTD